MNKIRPEKYANPNRGTRIDPNFLHEPTILGSQTADHLNCLVQRPNTI